MNGTYSSVGRTDEQERLADCSTPKSKVVLSLELSRVVDAQRSPAIRIAAAVAAPHAYAGSAVACTALVVGVENVAFDLGFEAVVAEWAALFQAVTAGTAAGGVGLVPLAGFATGYSVSVEDSVDSVFGTASRTSGSPHSPELA